MPTPSKGARLGGSPAHERLMLANLATALFEHRRITTTEAKARRLRPFAERLVTKAKRGDLHARRQVLSVISDKTVVHELFTEIAPGYSGRAGGYTRITKIGPRKGDNAPMAVIEMVEPLAEQTVTEATAATKRAAREQAERAAHEQAERAAAARGAAAPSTGSGTEEQGSGSGEQWKSAAEGGEGEQWKSAAAGKPAAEGEQWKSAAEGSSAAEGELWKSAAEPGEQGSPTGDAAGSPDDGASGESESQR